MRRCLAALLLTFALGSAVFADPGTVGVAIVGTAIGETAFAGTTIGVIVGNIAISAAATALLLGVNALLTKTPDEAKQKGQVTTRESVQPRRRGYGQYIAGAATMMAEISTVAEFAGGPIARHQVLGFHEGKIDAYVGHFFDDKPVALSDGDSGFVAGAGNIGMTAYMIVVTRKGAVPESPYGLDATFPGLVDANFRGDGIASALVIQAQPPNLENFTVAYPGGLGIYRPLIRASLVWDPRDEAQDKDGPSTWAWKDSPVLAAMDWHRHPDGANLGAFDDVLFTSAAITEDWIPAANICDEIVGGEKRYRLGGDYSIPEDAPADVLARILATCDGQTYTRHDGALGIRVGKTVAPTVTITGKDILEYELQSGDDVFLACNEVTAKYVSPAHGYQEQDAQPWRNEADITQRGQVLTRVIALPMVQSHGQARRLMKIAYARFNPAWKGTIVTGPAGLRAINQRYVHLTIYEVDSVTPLVDLDFEIIPDTLLVEFDAEHGFKCSFGVSSITQAAFDWNAETEAGTPPPVLEE